LDAFCYKIKMDKYYKDVQIDMDSLDSLPERPIDVSSRLKFVDCDIQETKSNFVDIQELDPDHFHAHPSSFVSRLPNEGREMEEIRTFIQNVDSTLVE
jgi:hypothetical protein